jgi:hypothetical protein
MQLVSIPNVAVEDSGVHFCYLALKLTAGDQVKTLVRALNFRPYRDNLEQRIIEWTWGGLEEAGLDEDSAFLSVKGGGSLSINPYYGTVTVFGGSPDSGIEENREEVAQLLREAFPSHDLSWFTPGHYEEQQRKEKEAKAAAIAAKKVSAEAKKVNDGTKGDAAHREEEA